jgi:hypothetical protein
MLPRHPSSITRREKNNTISRIMAFLPVQEVIRVEPLASLIVLNDRLDRTEQGAPIVPNDRPDRTE